MITVAVIDDSEKWLMVAENHLNKIKDCCLLAKMENGIEFIDWCYHKQLPDIALVDVEMPKMDGVQLTDFLAEHFPAVKVIAISSHTHREAVEDMIACGAYGYASKLYKLNNLDKAIETVAKGDTYIDPILQLSDIDRDLLMDKRRKEKALYAKAKLTLKQKAVVALYATNATQKEIATVLSVSPKTIENQVKTISGTLNVNSRQEFTLQSIRKGWTRISRLF